MTIPVYNAQEHGALDGTPGYNDFILTCRQQTEGERCGPLTVDDLPVDPNTGLVDTHRISTNWRIAPESIVDMYASRNSGAQVFRLPEGGYVLRRSIFDVPCTGQVVLARNFSLTPNQVRAIAAFSGSGYPGMWCSAPEAGYSYAADEPRPYQTPWNLQSREGLGDLARALENILVGMSGSSNLNSVQREALEGLDEAGIRSLIEEVGGRLENSDESSFFDAPWYEKIWDGLMIGIGFAVAHDLLQGPDSRILRGLRWLFRRGPPSDPPTGPTGPAPRPDPVPEPAPEPRPGVRRVEHTERRVVEEENSFWEDLGWGTLGVLAAVGTVAAFACPVDGPAGEAALGTATVGAFAQVGAVAVTTILVTRHVWEACREGEEGCMIPGEGPSFMEGYVQDGMNEVY